MGDLFALGLGGGGAAAAGPVVGAGRGAGLRLLAVVGVELAGGRRRHRRVVRTVRSASALVQRVVVVLAGGVRRHAQPQREAVGGGHAALVVVVVRGRSGRLVVVVAAVEAGLLEVRIHVWRGGGRGSTISRESYPKKILPICRAKSRKLRELRNGAQKWRKIIFSQNGKNVIRETRIHKQTKTKFREKFLRYKFRLKTYVRHGRKIFFSFTLSSI